MEYIEKYAPKKWDDLVFPSDFTKRQIERYAISATSIPLLLSGGPGVGKTACIEHIPIARGDDGSNVVDVDCTTDMTIAKFKSKLDKAVMHLGVGVHGERYVILNEIDCLPPRHQKALCVQIDKAPKSTLFLATTNHKQQIDASLLNRFIQVDFNPTSTKGMEDFAKKIFMLECVNASDQTIEALCRSVNGSFRMLLGILENYAYQNRNKTSAQQKSKPKKTA